MRAHLGMLITLLATVGPITAAQQPAAGRGAAGRGAAAAPEAAPPAPAAGSPATYKPGAELMEILKKNMSTTGEMTTAAVSNTAQYRVNIVHRSRPAGAIAHAGNTELHYIIEGAGTVVTGGTIVRPAAGSGALATIDGGVAKHVTKGDVVIVPENSAHWYKDIEGQITYLEVRWLAPKK
jgi:mannose-6-phosphate isomerase-like protein (cupin superfamily)